MRINKRKVVFLLVIITGITLFMNNLAKTKSNQKSLIVWTRFKPSSTDPMKYDSSVHHVTMRSVLASLVSIYKNGEVAAQIASQWEKSSDSKEWKVTIDKEWMFENGDAVTPAIVVRSFKRVLMLKNREKSRSGFLEYLQEAEDLKQINQEISGLSIDGDNVIFKFTKSMPNFLEKVSFGFYSIVHPNDYSEDGSWINDRNVISSGKYRISTWDDNNFQLERWKKDTDKKEIEKIVFSFADNSESIEESDIMIREKLNPYADPALWTYASTTQDNNITYVKVEKWNDSNSLLHDRKTREILRNIFYDSLEASGLNATKSFFPLSISGVKSFDYEKGLSFNYGNREFTTQPFFYNKKSGVKELGQLYFDAFQLFNNKIKAIPKNLDYPPREEDEKKIFDIQFLGTGILIDSPKEDIRFMFLSKQGIKLPDETGEILKYLEEDNFDVQRVNELLWKQAIIWPIRHYSAGFWTKNSSGIDTSELNLTLHPIDFQFVYWK